MQEFDVRSGATTGTSLSLVWYALASAGAAPLLSCTWIFAASYTTWSWGPCLLTMARRYLHAWMAALRGVLGFCFWPLRPGCLVQLPLLAWSFYTFSCMSQRTQTWNWCTQPSHREGAKGELARDLYIVRSSHNPIVWENTTDTKQQQNKTKNQNKTHQKPNT